MKGKENEIHTSQGMKSRERRKRKSFETLYYYKLL
jgi:hypothetical protein